MIAFHRNGFGLTACNEWEPKCWVNVETPNDEDMRYLVDELHIPEAFYNDVEDFDERPRMEMEDGWTFIIIRIPVKYEDSKIPFATIPLGLIFKEDVFVSVCFQKTEIVTDFITFIRRKNITIGDDFDFVLRMILSSSVWFLKYLKQINQSIKLAENKLERSIRNEDLQTLLQLEKCLVFFTTSLKGNDMLVHRLRNLRSRKDTYDIDLLEDVGIELHQALDMTNIYSDILSGMMDAYASVISNNLNIVMKQLTSISIILMIPTLVASLYGMNFDKIPLMHHENGFWIVVVGSLVLSAVGIYFFMKKKWF